MNTGDSIRIGIIGAGIAGASAAYFVRNEFGEDGEIVVFERNDRIGGRIKDIKVGPKHIEAGAKGIHSSNRYLLEFIDIFDLTRGELRLLSDPKLGIWDGEAFIFKTTDSRRRIATQLLRRYGVRPLLGLTRALLRERKAIKALRRLYPALDENGIKFNTINELLSFLNIQHLTGITGQAYFRDLNVPERCINELIGGMTRWIYAQNPTMHAAATLGIATGGATGSFYQVEEGNRELCRDLLNAADAEVRRNTQIKRLLECSDKYTAVSKKSRDQFNAIIVATPREIADINMDGLDSSVNDREFQTVHLAYILGDRNPVYFGTKDAGSIPEIITTPATGNLPFLGINEYRHDGSQNVSEVLSVSPITDETLSEMFTTAKATERIKWAGYPTLSPITSDQPFRLKYGLYYVNAMESFVSTMESEVIGSRNVVNLLTADFK